MRDPRPDDVQPQRVLVAADLGEVGESAIRIGHARASASGGHLAVCHVREERVDEAPVREALRDMVRAAIGAAADEVEVFVPTGNPAEQIQACAAAWNAELVVIGRSEHPSGVLARLFKHDVVDQVVRWAPCAVLVTRHAPGTSRVVVGCDFVDEAAPLFAAAAAEQARSGAEVTVVHCVAPAVVPLGDPLGGLGPPPPVEALAAGVVRDLVAAFPAAGLTATTKITFAPAAEGVIETARELAADLVIVGTHDRSRLARLALGSVAAQVVRDAPCPVLVVRLGR